MLFKHSSNKHVDDTLLHLDFAKMYMELSTFTVNFPGGSVVKNLPVNAGDVGSIPGSRRSPEEENGNSL